MKNCFSAFSSPPPQSNSRIYIMNRCFATPVLHKFQSFLPLAITVMQKDSLCAMFKSQQFSVFPHKTYTIKHMIKIALKNNTRSAQ